MAHSVWVMLDNIKEKFSGMSINIISGLIVFIVFLCLAAIFKAVFLRVGKKIKISKDVVALSARVIYSVLIVFGLVFALGTAGVNVSALIASLGLTGFALGFALRDALSNILAGMLILTYRPFKAGDNIIISGFEGEVKDIDLRYTTLVSDNKKVLIPNSNLFTNPVVIVK